MKTLRHLILKLTARGLIVLGTDALSPAQFEALAEVPPELEWLANLTNPKIV